MDMIGLAFAGAPSPSRIEVRGSCPADDDCLDCRREAALPPDLASDSPSRMPLGPSCFRTTDACLELVPPAGASLDYRLRFLDRPAPPAENSAISLRSPPSSGARFLRWPARASASFGEAGSRLRGAPAGCGSTCIWDGAA